MDYCYGANHQVPGSNFQTLKYCGSRFTSIERDPKNFKSAFPDHLHLMTESWGLRELSEENQNPENALAHHLKITLIESGMEMKFALQRGNADEISQCSGDRQQASCDQLGSTVALTDASGAVTEQTSYDSFGNQTKTSFSSRYQYTGREYDSFSGFYY